MKRFLSTAAFAALITLLGAPARSQDNNCVTQKLQQLCPGMKDPACVQGHGAEAAMACQQQQAQAANDNFRSRLKEKSPCMDDVAKYCPGKWPGTPEFSSCMKTHEKDLSPACAAYAKKRASMGGATNTACVGDARKFCPGLGPTDGAKLGACMAQHTDELSPTCRKSLKTDKADAAKAKLGAGCMSVVANVCGAGVMPGSPQFMTCVHLHPQELAPCRRPAKDGDAGQ
jgi:hypothetical protein